MSHHTKSIIDIEADRQRHGDSAVSEPAATPPPKAPRLASLDALRGITIVLMLLVNNMMLGSATPLQLLHAPWGARIRLADFVFPWFLLCVGIAIPFAAASFRRHGKPAWRFDMKVLWRATLLVLFGCLIASSAQQQWVFSLGVLQLIGLAYLGAALLYDLPVWRRLGLALLIFAIYGASIQSFAAGSGTHAIHEQDNLIWFLNVHVFNTITLAGRTFNIWGLPSVIPTMCLVLIGTVIGDLLRLPRLGHRGRVGGLLVAGLALMAGGLLWQRHLLMSKALWTPSYMLFTAGVGTLVLALLYLLIDIRPSWGKWAYPLRVFGSNAILAYMAPILVKFWILERCRIGAKQTVEQWLLATWSAHAGPILAGWSYTALYILSWWVILWILYRKKWFLRV